MFSWFPTVPAGDVAGLHRDGLNQADVWHPRVVGEADCRPSDVISLRGFGNRTRPSRICAAIRGFDDDFEAASVLSQSAGASNRGVADGFARGAVGDRLERERAFLCADRGGKIDEVALCGRNSRRPSRTYAVIARSGIADEFEIVGVFTDLDERAAMWSGGA